jgi:hypothetical protein
MKRWLVIGGVILLSYIIAYRFLPWRNCGRFRKTEVFVHTREFRYKWQAQREMASTSTMVSLIMSCMMGSRCCSMQTRQPALIVFARAS